jgi:hypothetical protein
MVQRIDESPKATTRRAMPWMTIALKLYASIFETTSERSEEV